MKIKKVAMFGLDFERSRKQFGKLFLAKRHSEAPQGANGSCGKGRINLFKHAAMFGLDARIALAIFGALSVISGAALYSAIKNAKTVSFITQIREVSKAVEQYYLDVGSNLPFHVDNTNSTLTAGDLIENNNINGWNGPYLNGFTVGNINHNINSNLNGKQFSYFIYQCKDTFGGELSNLGCGGSCGSTKPCYVYLKIITNINNKPLSIAREVDKQIDGADGFDKGNFRVNFANAVEDDDIRMFYKVKPW